MGVRFFSSKNQRYWDFDPACRLSVVRSGMVLKVSETARTASDG